MFDLQLTPQLCSNSQGPFITAQTHLTLAQALRFRWRAPSTSKIWVEVANRMLTPNKPYRVRSPGNPPMSLFPSEGTIPTTPARLQLEGFRMDGSMTDYGFFDQLF